MVAFLYGGEGILKLFGLDVQSFCGSWCDYLLLFRFLGDDSRRSFFQKSAGTAVGTVVPIAFPLIAGAGTMTTLISLKSKYENVDILAAIFLNIIVVFAVLHFSDYIKGEIRRCWCCHFAKGFGIILLAIAIKL
ncbi:MAG: MarC family protein [Saprospiraceae bacterium]|nr:MarC family protein [Saprospiraceae bacterium]